MTGVVCSERTMWCQGAVGDERLGSSGSVDWVKGVTVGELNQSLAPPLVSDTR